MTEELPKQQASKKKPAKRAPRNSIAAELGAPSAEPEKVAEALGLSLAQLALKLRSEETQVALDALHDLFSVCAELGVARTRAEAAGQLERLVREASSLEATPDQVRRLLIDVLKLADQRPRRVVPDEAVEARSPTLSASELASLRAALEQAAETEADDDENIA